MLDGLLLLVLLGYMKYQCRAAHYCKFYLICTMQLTRRSVAWPCIHRAYSLANAKTYS
ncbi:hypothetical protein BC826DRAFT_689555 [Russula brevipes]|nr:hypothetical protein BC826DRAFT_689555 [Russula brevipes]